MRELAETAHALHRVVGLPLDMGCEIFAHYPTMKLGVRGSVTHYARKLVPLVEAVIAERPGRVSWTLTAPPFQTIPAAANLMCRELYGLMRDRLPPSIELRLVEIAERAGDAGECRSNATDSYGDYSRLSWQERIALRERSAPLLMRRDDLRGRAVIFINDINVTGAQQRIMRCYFEEVSAAEVHWIYIIDTAPSIGRQMPEIEYMINNSTIGSFDEFSRIMTTEDLELTAKGVDRTFSYEVPELARLIGMLPSFRRSRLLRLILEDTRYRAPCFKEKIELLRALCPPSDTPSLLP